MARGKKPSVRYWASRGAYCCWIKGVQHVLAAGPDDAASGPTYLAALERFRKLLSLEDGKGTDDYLVSAMLNQYRAHLRKTRKSDAPGIFDSMARSFSKAHGHLAVKDLKPHMVEEWLDTRETWNATSKAHGGRLVLAAVAWAHKKGLVASDPIGGKVDLPSPVMRGRDARMSPELMDVLIDAAYSGNRLRTVEFPKLLWALRLTGARPVEIVNAEAMHLDRGRIVFRWNATAGYVHKTAKRTQRDRVIHLTPGLWEYAAAQAKLYPRGPVFRTPRGFRWTKNSLHNAWRRLTNGPTVAAFCRERDIDPVSLRMYSFRHTWISDYLDETGDYYGCAQMCGTSIKMLEQRYSHPDVERLHERFLAYSARLTTAPSPSAPA